ncbi:MAG: hypothetical protein H0U75_06800 [Legionella sp.]|nr:hypothetical protein [Legionella sp.]
MKKKTIALVAAIIVFGVFGGLILGQILKLGLLSIGPVVFAGLTTAAILTGFGLLTVSAVLIGLGCYQLWKSPTREYNILNLLPKAVLQHHVTKFLGDTDVGAFASSNKSMHSFLQPHRMLSSLLRSVVTGNEARVIQILKSYPELAVRQGFVTDNSGRSFPRASAAELVRWCGDLRYMANAMLDVLLHLSNQKLAEQIRITWVEQYAAYEQEGGLVYMLPGKTEPEKPSLAFSLAPLLREQQAYIDNFDMMTRPQRQAYWCTKVGAEQFLLTAIYLQHYCNPDVPFYPKPSFDKPTFPRVLTIYNYNTSRRQSVWERAGGGSGLGLDFAIYRYECPMGCGANGDAGGGAHPGRYGTLIADLDALGACEEGTGLDLDLFKGRLGEPLNQQPQAESKSLHYSSS